MLGHEYGPQLTQGFQAPKHGLLSRGLERCAGSESRLGTQESCAHPDKRLVVGTRDLQVRQRAAHPHLPCQQGWVRGRNTSLARGELLPLRVSTEAKACVGRAAGRGNLRARESGEPGPKASLPRPREGGSRESSALAPQPHCPERTQGRTATRGWGPATRVLTGSDGVVRHPEDHSWPARGSESPHAGPCRIRRAAALQAQGKGHESVSAALVLHPRPCLPGFGFVARVGGV